MKIKKLLKLPVYWKILIALFLGIAFGSFFKVDTHSVKITFLKDGNKINSVLTGWEGINIRVANDSSKNKTFSGDDQTRLIKYFQKIKKQKVDLLVDKGVNKENYQYVSEIARISTIATDIKFIGNIFVRLLSFIAIPLVLASLIVGAGSLGEVKKLGRIGGTTFFIYIITTAVAIVIGLILANSIKPGEKLTLESKNRLLSVYGEETSEKIGIGDISFNIVKFIEEIIPTNPLRALAQGDMLQIVFFAVMVGLVINFLDKRLTDPVINFFSGFSEIMIKMVDIIMTLAPYGVFALISATIAEFGTGIIITLFWYVLTVLSGLLIHSLLIYPLLVKFLGKMSPLKFFKGMRTAMAIAFSTSSSAATLPVTFDCVEKKLGVPNKIAGFVLPLGATINMDGTALYQGVATIFIAQVYGINLDLAMQLTIIFTAVMASIGTAPVPGVGIIMLIMILNSVNVPAEGIALILGVDRFLDMCRTVPNILGDSAVSVSIWGLERKKGMEF